MVFGGPPGRDRVISTSFRRIDTCEELRNCLLALEWMRFGVEDDFVEVESGLGSEEQVEILQRFSEEEAFHAVGLLLGADVFERGVSVFGAAILFQIIQIGLTHGE